MVQAPKMPYSCNIFFFPTAVFVFKDEFGPKSAERNKFTGQHRAGCQAVIQTTAFRTCTA